MGPGPSATFPRTYHRPYPIMRAIRTLKFSLLLALALPIAASAQATPKPDTVKVDVTGKWAFSVQSDVGSGTPTVTFVQKGDSVSGRYSSQALGERDFVGTYKAGKISFSFTAEAGGQSFTMSFAGAIDDRDSMSGAIDFAGMATGTFSGKRVKP
jgi:hypothetical protein